MRSGEAFRPAQVSGAGFKLTLSHRGRFRSLSLPTPVFYLAIGLLPLLGVWYLGATVYLIFRDDLLAALMNRQAVMQYVYEDRIAGLHGQIERATSNALLQRTMFDGRLHDLSLRATQLESRTAAVALLAERAGALGERNLSTADASAPRHAEKADPARSPNPLLSGAFAPARGEAPLPAIANAFAPLAAPQPPVSLPTESLALRRGQNADTDSETRIGQTAPAAAEPLPLISGKPTPAPDAEALPDKSSKLEPRDDPQAALASLGVELENVERAQMRILGALRMPAQNEAARIRAAIAEIGFSPDQLKAPPGATSRADEATGGPFVPLPDEVDSSPFYRQAATLQALLQTTEHLRGLVTYVPLRKPLLGPLEVTSGFGARIDPFLGRPALHTGVDLRNEYGASVRATAAGRVTFAGYDGGYGNMVEIDHGNGLVTRYGHLSAILVEEGQRLRADAIIGRIGATGRATGPHLHYETRIDGEPVDPTRFLRAGQRLFPSG